MKKNTRRARLQSLDAAQLQQVSGGISASTELISAAINLIDLASDYPAGSLWNTFYATAASSSLQ